MHSNKRLYFKDINGIKFLAFLPFFFYIITSQLSDLRINTGFTYDLFLLSDSFKQITLEFTFFISSFLITSQALREIKYRHYFSIRKYYMRRFLRILPILIIGLIVLFYLHGKIISILKLTPFENFDEFGYYILIPNFLYEFNNPDLVYVVCIWLIFMLIQFYFVWGLILKIFIKHIKIISMVMIIIGIFVLVAFYFLKIKTDFNTFSYLISIGIGSYFAHLMRDHDAFQSFIKNLSKIKIRLIYFSLIVVMFLFPIFHQTMFYFILPILFTINIGLIIAEQTYSKNSSFKFRKNKLIDRWGKISYGMFIYSSIISVMIIISFESVDKGMENLLFKFLFPILTFLITWVIADLSYNFYEKLFLRIKRDFKRI